MDFARLRRLVSSDLYRYTGRLGARSWLKALWWEPGFRYMALSRTCRALSDSRWRTALLPARAAANLLLRRWEHHYGISVPPSADVGPGLYIGHYGGIFVHPNATLGRDCNLSHGITIGVDRRGERAGIPTLGDRVYLAPGAKLFGAIEVGDDVAVGANAVVTRDVPAGSVVAGVPGRVISDEGSSGYVNRTDYDGLLEPPDSDDSP